MPTERFAFLETPIPADVAEMTGLHFLSLTGQDEVSKCFRFQVAALSTDPNISSADLLGQSVTVSVYPDPDDDKVGQSRFFNGIVDRFRFVGDDDDGYFRYELIVRPKLWELGKQTDNRIFQQLSAQDIITQILDQHAVTDYTWELMDRLPERDYCVQYGESDLNFVQRLLEEEGVFYYFRYDDGAHTLVFADSLSDRDAAEGCEELPYEPHGRQHQGNDLSVTSFRRTDSIVSGTHSLTDYDFEKPSADLAAQMVNPMGHPEDNKERYHYPGRYTDYGRGESLAVIRNQGDQSMVYDITAVTTTAKPASGNTFTLVDFPRNAENGDYFILRASYDIWDGEYASKKETTERGSKPGVTATWRCVPKTVMWRPARVTPKSVMKGPQTAVVVGPAGEEIFTDQYSRVKVQFHWDRLGGSDENSSCFVRVSSVWAGAGWGFIQIPRIGQEVIVDFLEGDPDRPIITGRVYNAEQMPPYELPANMTQSGWKSNSSKGGGGWNELRFEDLKGSEEVYFQAEKDHNELIKNDESRNIGHDFLEDVGNDAEQNIGHDRTETVGNDKSTTVRMNRTVNIGQNDTEDVGQNRSLTVGADETISIGNNSTETIGMNHKQTVGLMQTTVVGGGRSDKVGLAELRAIGGAQSLTVGLKRIVRVGSKQERYVQSDDTFEVKGKQTTTIHKEHEVKVAKEQDFWIDGMQTFMVKDNMFHHTEKDGTFKADKEILVEAGDAMVLKCGKAAISLKKDGTITIEGKDITIKGSGKIVGEAKGEMTLKGSKINQN